MMKKKDKLSDTVLHYTTAEFTASRHSYRSILNRLLSDRQHLQRCVSGDRQKLDELESLNAATLEAQKLLQSVAAAVQEQAHKQIANLVSRCLEAVFPEPYEFRILFEQKRGKTEARLVFIRDGEEIDPVSSSGGGVIDVAAFALRLSCLMLVRPRKRRLLLLDEPFRYLSSDYRPAVRDLLQSLVDELEVQIIMVTHDEILKIGNVVEVG